MNGALVDVKSCAFLSVTLTHTTLSFPNFHKLATTNPLTRHDSTMRYPPTHPSSPTHNEHEETIKKYTAIALTGANDDKEEESDNSGAQRRAVSLLFGLDLSVKYSRSIGVGFWSGNIVSVYLCLFSKQRMRSQDCCKWLVMTVRVNCCRNDFGNCSLSAESINQSWFRNKQRNGRSAPPKKIHLKRTRPRLSTFSSNFLERRRLESFGCEEK
jgi:hypothetical protein